MNLHEDKEIFLELVQTSAQSAQLPQIYIEKDYWISNALRNLAYSDFSQSVVFKGGTSLSKAHRLVERFSEDIDLALVDINQPDGKKKRALKAIEEVAAQGLSEVKDQDRVSKGSKFRKTVWEYPRITEDQNFGQASFELLIEVNAFVEPNPHTEMAMQSIVGEELFKADRNDLIEKFNLESFNLNVLAVERTLAEKVLFLAKHSYSESPIEAIGNGIRHLYDVHQILKEQKHKDFMLSAEFSTLCQKCVDQEITGWKEEEWHKYPLELAPIFINIDEWSPALDRVYKGAFAPMVCGDLPDFSETVSYIKLIRDSLIQAKT
jgi:predicted nucleotidyltransferase component of viral defense system